MSLSPPHRAASGQQNQHSPPPTPPPATVGGTDLEAPTTATSQGPPLASKQNTERHPFGCPTPHGTRRPWPAPPPRASPPRAWPVSRMFGSNMVLSALAPRLGPRAARTTGRSRKGRAAASASGPGGLEALHGARGPSPPVVTEHGLPDLLWHAFRPSRKQGHRSGRASGQAMR